MKIFTCIASCFLLIISGCGKDKDNEHDGSVIRIEGYDLFDASGNEIGHVGREDDDWSFVNNLTAQELALFDFPSPYSLDNTKETTISFPRSIPNPTNWSQSFFAEASDSVLVKMVIVNNKLQPLLKTVQKGTGRLGLTFALTDRNTFKGQTSYRLYYSFSAAGKPNFKTGYGDIRICDDPNTCFK